VATTDQLGVARFEGLEVGRATIAVLTVDYAFARRESLEINVANEGAWADAVMQPIAVGAVVVDGLPAGWWLQPISSLPEGWRKHPSFTDPTAAARSPPYE
jgi:hypothetical protein